MSPRKPPRTFLASVNDLRSNAMELNAILRRGWRSGAELEAAAARR